MEKETLLIKTMQNIKKLPVSKVQEVNYFVEFLLNRIDDQIFTEGINLNNSQIFLLQAQTVRHL